MDDFLTWLNSREGQNSEQALLDVMDALKNCSVDPRKKVLIWNDGKRLSITQTARRIHSLSTSSLPQIESHVVGWLEMHYEPKGLNEKQMEQFETMIEDWIQEEQISKNGALDLL